MTAQEIAEHIATLPVGAKVTVVYEVGDTPSSPAGTPRGAGSPPPSVPTPVPQPPTQAGIKLKEATRRFGLPIREMQRAVKGGFLTATPKVGGKDAGAHLVEPPDVAAYRDRRERILRGEEAAPTNWPGPKPRKGGAA